MRSSGRSSLRSGGGEINLEHMTAPTFCFYVSDYGNGHAARCIAIIRRISEEWSGARIYVKTAGPFSFLKDSLASYPGCIVIETQNDIGVVLKPGRPVVDTAETRSLLIEWVASWDAYISSEERFCREHAVDCIISDIAPQPFLVANALGIPGVAVSNFTWHLIFSTLFGDIHETRELERAYGCCDLALMLPFHEPMEVFPNRKEIGLISREVTVDRETLRRSLGVLPEETLIFLNCGAEMPETLKTVIREAWAPGLRILVSSHLVFPEEHIISIPDGEMETQNYLAACDLIVSKCGYSTISEAVRAGVPLLLYRREGFAEDAYLIDSVTAEGFGREISWDALVAGEWLSDAAERKADKSTHMRGGTISFNGADDILSLFHEVLQ
jgi:hypothetical protein